MPSAAHRLLHRQQSPPRARSYQQIVTLSLVRIRREGAGQAVADFSGNSKPAVLTTDVGGGAEPPGSAPYYMYVTRLGGLISLVSQIHGSGVLRGYQSSRIEVVRPATIRSGDVRGEGRSGHSCQRHRSGRFVGMRTK